VATPMAGASSTAADRVGVVVTPANSPNDLGVVRAFGRRGIPVLYIDSKPRSIAAHSRFVSSRVRVPGGFGGGERLVDVLLREGGSAEGKSVIIPTGDEAVLTLSRHRDELERCYHLPVASLDAVESLVDKKRFYRLLAARGVPHPVTRFVPDPGELLSIGRALPFPFIVKPADSMAFRGAFGRKCFLIESAEDLARAAARLRDTDLEVLLQEVIPGRDIYCFYTYFDRDSEPLALCGWDKVRQYEPDFGCGTFCRSVWRPRAAEPALRLLVDIGYHGFAEPELKKDPRDGQYKLLEINARTTLQNRLPAACGVDVEYAAYLDCIGSRPEGVAAARSGVLWVDDFLDQVSFLTHLRRWDMSCGEVLDSLKPRKVHSVAAWDDPLPLVFQKISHGSPPSRSSYERAAQSLRIGTLCACP